MSNWIISGNAFTQGITQPKSFFLEEFSPRMLRALDSCINDAINMNQPVLPLTIHSPGGCIFVLNGAISILQKAKNKGIQLITIVTSTAQSAGSLLFMFGDQRFISPNGHLMIHAPSLNDATGKLAEVKSLVGALEGAEKPLLESISKNLHKRANWLEKKITSKGGVDWHLNAQQALAEGVATSIHIPSFHLELETNFFIT